MEKHEKKSLVQPYAGGCRSALSRQLGMLRLQGDVVSRRDTCQIQDGGLCQEEVFPRMSALAGSLMEFIPTVEWLRRALLM